MIARIEISESHDLLAIAIVSGSSGYEGEIYYENGSLFVKDVTQQALDDALAAYDPIPDVRKRMVGTSNAAFEQAMTGLTADYPPSEITSWERQRAEALAWDGDSQAPTPWIDIAAQTRGVERDVYLARTLAKVNLFAQSSAFLVGRRQAIDDALRAATTSAELEAIVINYTLPGAP